MTVDPEAYKRPFSFHIASQSWSHQAGSASFEGPIVEKIHIGQYGPRGNITAFSEFVVEWHRFTSSMASPRLCLYNDAWGVFGHPQIQALLSWMKDDGVFSEDVGPERVTPTVFVEALLSLGFIDVTQRESSDDEQRQWTSLRIEAQRILGLPEHERLNRVTKLLQDRTGSAPEPKATTLKVEALFFRITTPPGDVDIDRFSELVHRDGGFYYTLDRAILAFPMGIDHDDFVVPQTWESYGGIKMEGVTGETAARWLATLNDDTDRWLGYREKRVRGSVWREVISLTEALAAAKAEALAPVKILPQVGAFFWRILTPPSSIDTDVLTKLMASEGAFYFLKDSSILAFPAGLGNPKRAQPGNWEQAGIEVESIDGDGAEELWANILNSDLTAWGGYTTEFYEPVTLDEIMTNKEAAEAVRAATAKGVTRG